VDQRMKPKLKILFFGTQMAIGGAQKLLLGQARWFRDHGHDVTAVFFYDKQGLQERWQDGLGFPLLTLTSVGPRASLIERPWALAAGLLRLWVLLRGGRFDVIETFTYDSNVLALPIAWLAGVPARIATHHGIIENFPAWIERLHAWLVNAGIASVLVSVSGKTLEQAIHAGIRPERNTVIPNGIPPMIIGSADRSEVRREIGVENGEPVLLSVGRLVYQKGHEYLVHAMPRVLGRYPHAKAVICGEGALRPDLERQIGELGLESRVRLVGNRNDVGKFLASADVFVLPSRWEGLPVALLEAMGAGLPVVATRVEGVEEVVEDERQGLLIPPEDAEALAAALLQLIGDPQLRKQMGEAGRTRIQSFYTLDIMCDKYLRVMLQYAHPKTH
jgi:glycosyltransferase involved in cell wall biosynthesis